MLFRRGRAHLSNLRQESRGRRPFNGSVDPRREVDPPKNAAATDGVGSRPCAAVAAHRALRAATRLTARGSASRKAKGDLGKWARFGGGCVRSFGRVSL
jgi:hypothetical protein